MQRVRENLRYIEFAVSITLMLMLGLASYQRNSAWKDDITLWSDVVQKSPLKARVYDQLGLAYHKAGDQDKAILQYSTGLSLNLFYADLHNNIGISYFDKGIVDEAIQHFRHAIEIDPEHGDAHYNLGIAYGSKGLNDLANAEMRMGAELRAKYYAR